MQIAEREPIDVSGSPRERGRAIAAAGEKRGALISRRILTAVEPSADEAAWIDRQWEAQKRHLPEMCELVEGLAKGHGVSARQLFTRHVGYALEDRRRRPAPADPDGCSAFAVRTSKGVLVCKNRDNPPDLEPLQTLIRQQDPAWGGRRTLSIGSFGSAPSASSGINSDGLCMVDTSVRTFDLGIGVLRYYLMDAILYQCGDVPEALALIRSLPHLGGGNLVLGDAGGRMAAVEIAHGRVAVEEDEGRGWVARTNHFLDAELAADMTTLSGSEARDDSESRLGFIRSRLAPGVTSCGEAQCAAILSSRGEDGYVAICKDTPTVLTLSGAIFDPIRLTLLQSHGLPSDGRWRRTGFGHAAAGRVDAARAAHPA
jgi:isopenicillin-N N-acyltransferase-like protein